MGLIVWGPAVYDEASLPVALVVIMILRFPIMCFATRCLSLEPLHLGGADDTLVLALEPDDTLATNHDGTHPRVPSSLTQYDQCA